MLRILLVLIFFNLCGCTTSPTREITQKSEARANKQYKRYIENVFRRQNRAMSQIILLPVDELGVSVQQDLLNAEQSATSRCKVLNDIASLRSEGKKESMLQKLKVSRSIRDCENATLELEYLLERASEELMRLEEV